MNSCTPIAFFRNTRPCVWGSARNRAQLRANAIRQALGFAFLFATIPVLAADDDFFEKRIRPTLHEQCMECHGPEKQKGGLRLDSREAMLQGGDSGPALIPGNASQSLLLKAVQQIDKDLSMPPSKSGPKLPDNAIEDLRQWIQSGAPWPKTSATPAPGKKETFDLEARKQRLPWIWKSPQRGTVPTVEGLHASTDVDRFIAAALEEKGLKPGAPTDDRTWLRRVHFAITGLPPRIDQQQAFLGDTTPGRRERVVDALLASPHFGERWARHWMDLVRYAESRGHESDYDIANAWRYRDYLVRAINADVPYNQFVAEHVAGDLLNPRLNPTTGANESVLATGWAFLGEEVHSPVDIRQDECERIDNKVDVLSKTFLGLTVACARCHDHKFDAITQQDYYALSGFVLSSPFRQVRYETMESHAAAAHRLGIVRREQAATLRTALSRVLASGMDPIGPILTNLSRVWRGESTETVPAPANLDPMRWAKWVERLKPAVTNTAHPLHIFASLAAARGPESFTRSQQSPQPTLLPPGTLVIADYTRDGITPWKVDGPAFGTRPLRAGELVFGSPSNPIARVMPYGAASRDAFWNRLSLTPGTEMDSGSLGSAARAGKTLLSPKFTLKTGRLHYLIRGKASVYAGVDSHLMVLGPLHGSLVASFDTGDQVRWVTHDLSAYAGHRAHLEFAPQGDASLDILQVVDAKDVPAAVPVQPWRPSQEAAHFNGLVEQLQADLRSIANSFSSPEGQSEARLATLTDWVAQNAELFGDTTSVRNAASAGFEAQQQLASELRWDSPTAISWGDGTGTDEHVLVRGKPSKPGSLAPRGMPEAFGLQRVAPRDSSGRRDLAQQMTDPSNPMVARVLVNRVWHHLFGRGIVPTVDNFGFLGERPSHPELLDHLAWKFVHEEDWSLKHLIRQLVLTDTFARTSRSDNPRAEEIDPSNRLLHRMPVRRLEGESIRDSLLTVSGRLDPKPFGPPVPVHLTEFIVGRGRPDVSGPLDGAGRRSLYTSVRRNFLSTMMVAFDYPTPFSTVGRRNVTNVPGQSLVLMNDPFVRDQAEVWARRLLREVPEAGVEMRIAWLFESGFGRPPTRDELATAQDSLNELRSLYSSAPEAAVWSEFCHALLSANEFIYLK